MQDYLNIAATILASLGGASLIILALSNYIGKIWASRLMANEKHNHNIELEELRNKLKNKSDEQLSAISNNYEIFKQTHLREENEKLIIYRSTIDIISVVLAKIEISMFKNNEALNIQEKESFETERFRVYGYLAMLAPQEVMDANDRLTDLLLSLVYDGKTIEWVTIRDAALKLTNAMRNDIGLNKTDISYNGER